MNLKKQISLLLTYLALIGIGFHAFGTLQETYRYLKHDHEETCFTWDLEFPEEKESSEEDTDTDEKHKIYEPLFVAIPSTHNFCDTPSKREVSNKILYFENYTPPPEFI